MSFQASFALRGRNPDVLTCIANLSNDEVFAPPEFANRMLDTLAEAWAAGNGGANIWADKMVRFLDPCTKSGVFLREITSRLNKGLDSNKVRDKAIPGRLIYMAYRPACPVRLNPCLHDHGKPGDDFLAEEDFIDVSHVQHVNNPAQV